MAAAVRRWLRDHDRWLLVLDNAQAPDMLTGLQPPLDRLADLIPQVLHGQVLVTTRDARWQRAAALAELDLFTPEEAVRFLLARAGSTDTKAAGQVAELLGRLPLALEQAGAYTSETGIGLAAYLQRLQQLPELTLAKGEPRDRDPADTVATTWRVSIEQVRPIPGAVVLLELCAFLAPEEIPRELFSQRLDSQPERLEVFADDPFALDEAIGGLRRFGLAKASEQTLTVHRLLQQVIRAHPTTSDSQSAITDGVKLLAAAFPSSTHKLRDPTRWAWCAQLLPHLLAVAGHAQEAGTALEPTAELLRLAGIYLERRGEYAAARRLIERALTLTEAVYRPDDLKVAYVLDSLGYVVRVQGDLAGARRLHERALAIIEAATDSDRPDELPKTKLLEAFVLHNLGRVLHAQGDLAGARARLEHALAKKQAALPPDDPDVAATLGSLGTVLRDQGDLAGARVYLERTLAIDEVTRGPNHPDVGRTRGAIDVVLHGQGDLAGARDYMERALRILEASLGPDHRDVGRTLGSLGAVLHDQGDIDTARSLFERALAIFETRLGADHPETARSRQNLAAVVGGLDKQQ